MNDCIFCKIIVGEIPTSKIYEDDKHLVFLDINPINPGHVLIIPKEHYSALSETPDEVAAEMMRIVPKLAKAVMKAVDAPAFNLALNNGRVAGQEVDHVHLHIMPRHPGDGYQLWRGKPYDSDEQRDNTVKAIKENL